MDSYDKVWQVNKTEFEKFTNSWFMTKFKWDIQSTCKVFLQWTKLRHSPSQRCSKHCWNSNTFQEIGYLAMKNPSFLTVYFLIRKKWIHFAVRKAKSYSNLATHLRLHLSPVSVAWSVLGVFKETPLKLNTHLFKNKRKRWLTSWDCFSLHYNLFIASKQL